MKMHFIFIILFLSVLACSCTRIPRKDDDVSAIIECRIDKRVQWHRSCLENSHEENQALTTYIQTLLSHPLTPQSAVQIALLNNPRVQAGFEELGISQADLVEAGLLSNPIFDITFRWPNRRGTLTNIEDAITASFLDAFLIPLRTRVAEVEFEQMKRHVAHEILTLAFDVQQTFHELQMEQQKFKYIQAIADLISIHSEIASKQHTIGNINQLNLERIQARLLKSKVEVTQAETEILFLKEKLNRLLGFYEESCWILSDEFFAIDVQEPDLCILESIAFKKRLDLQEARFEFLRLSHTLGLQQWWVYTEGRIGISSEKDPDGTFVIGPVFVGQIPLFNFGQAARLRLVAELERAQDLLAALEIEVLAEVREGYQLLINDASIINDFRSQILPLQNKILTSSEELYNVMGLGIERLLESKQEQLQTYMHYLDSLKNYWVARVQLDRALGGHLFQLLEQETYQECSSIGIESTSINDVNFNSKGS